MAREIPLPSLPIYLGRPWRFGLHGRHTESNNNSNDSSNNNARSTHLPRALGRNSYEIVGPEQPTQMQDLRCYPAENVAGYFDFKKILKDIFILYHTITWSRETSEWTIHRLLEMAFNRVEGRIGKSLIQDEDLELEKQLKIINKPTNITIRLKPQSKLVLLKAKISRV
ncbi:hypothetical protein Scep_026796 [Stephania cephalantha]|uniref:Uncharacterized protein n=1 Tax=Stephania cephalantha TaxID=152367 RepID=A0AAP0ER51_9MAGN